MYAIRQVVDLKGNELHIHVPKEFSNQPVEVIVLPLNQQPLVKTNLESPTINRLLQEPIKVEDFEPLSRDECHAR